MYCFPCLTVPILFVPSITSWLINFILYSYNMQMMYLTKWTQQSNQSVHMCLNQLLCHTVHSCHFLLYLCVGCSVFLCLDFSQHVITQMTTQWIFLLESGTLKKLLPTYFIYISFWSPTTYFTACLYTQLHPTRMPTNTS